MRSPTTAVLITGVLALTTTTTALSNPELNIDVNFSHPEIIFNPNNHTSFPSNSDPELKERQIGNAPVTSTLAATQYPTTTVAGSLFTAAGTTSATWQLFTQTFAAGPLGTWALGSTPLVGSIGLGSIAGTVGGVKTKRGMDAVQTAGPKM